MGEIFEGLDGDFGAAYIGIRLGHCHIEVLGYPFWPLVLHFLPFSQQVRSELFVLRAGHYTPLPLHFRGLISLVKGLGFNQFCVSGGISRASLVVEVIESPEKEKEERSGARFLCCLWFQNSTSIPGYHYLF